MSDPTGKRLVRQPRLAMIYGGWRPRHPIDTALSNSCSLAGLQALRLVLPLLGSAHTYFEHFDIFLGTVGKMIYVSLRFQPFYGGGLLERMEEGLSILALFAEIRQSPLQPLFLRCELWDTRPPKWVC